MIPTLLAALKFAPAVLSMGRSLVESITGEPVATDVTPEDLASHVDALPESQRAAITQGVLYYRQRLQELDTDRFRQLTEGDAAKVAATARPEIARRAMSVIETFCWAIRLLFVMTVIEWLVRAGYNFAGASFPVKESLWSLIAAAKPVSEMIWGPLIASFWVSADVIKKYMGCRERDKAQQYEMQAGRPLDSAAATVAAAGGNLAAIIKAVRGKQ